MANIAKASVNVLDRLKLPAQHFAIAFFTAAAASFVNAVQNAGGVSHLAWHQAGTAALDSGALAAGVVLLAAASPFVSYGGNWAKGPQA